MSIILAGLLTKLVSVFQLRMLFYIVWIFPLLMTYYTCFMSYNYYKYSFSLGFFILFYFIFYFKDSVELEVCIIVAVSSCI